MHERIHHPFNQKLVDLRFAAAELHDDLLVALARQIADHKSHAFEDLADLDHAHAHDAFAQVSQLAFHAQTCFLERTPNRGRRLSFQIFHLIFEPRTTDHELTNDAHQIVEPV